MSRSRQPWPRMWPMVTGGNSRLAALAHSLCFTPPTKFQDCAVSGPAHVEAFELDIAPFCNPTFSHYRAFELVTSIAEIATVRS